MTSMSEPTTPKRARPRTPNNPTTTGFRLSDELWAKLEPLLPVHPNTHRFGGGGGYSAGYEAGARHHREYRRSAPGTDDRAAAGDVLGQRLRFRGSAGDLAGVRLHRPHPGTRGRGPRPGAGSRPTSAAL